MSETPEWLDDKGKIIEHRYCQCFLEQHPMLSKGEGFFTTEGVVTDAINGTGKSSIAHALEYASLPDKLLSLTPYKYCGETPANERHLPRIVCSDPINTVAIFNDTYVSQYLFQPNDLLANSFEILIKTPDYDHQMQQIQEHIASIQETFQNNPELDELINELSAFIAGFGKAQNGYSKTGST